MPQSWPFDLGWLPQPAYLVGGCVRDALLNHQAAYLDLDFVLPQEAVETARRIAKHYDAGFVLLDEQRQIARIVFPQATADFALQMGGSLTEDLHRRDFTVNAIAYNPHTQTLIDPFNGRSDLEQKVIRMVHGQNLVEDPLRLLRAYRQAAQLKFTLDPATHAHITRLAPLIQSVSPERVREELGYLFSHPAGTRWLMELWRDGLLRSWFSHASEEGLILIGAIDQATVDLTATWPSLAAPLQRPLNQRAQGAEATRRTLLSTTKLVGILAPAPQQAKQTLQRLAYSRAEINVVLTLLQCWPQLSALLAADAPSRRDQYDLFQRAGTVFPALVLLAIASGLPQIKLAPLIKEYTDDHSAIAHPRPLVSGHTLMTKLNLKAGPELGKLLKKLEMAQADGTLTTTQEALEFAQTLCNQPSGNLTAEPDGPDSI